MDQAATSNLTSGRMLARNTSWSLAGQLLPMGVAVVTIPALVRGLGEDRFGLLSLAWIAIGYLSLFDLGIGRALTQLVAKKLGEHEEDSVPPLAWTSLVLLFLLGVCGGLATTALTPWLVRRILNIPTKLQLEAMHCFYLIAASVPLVTVTAGFRGILEAVQRFRILNVIRIPMSIFSLAGPLLAFPFSRSLTVAIAILVAGRLVGVLVHALACFHTMPSLRHNSSLQRSSLWPLMQFGGWMTVTNIISPVMVYIDRFLIGSLLSLPQVAYYAAPFDLVTRLSVIPAALSSVLFPAFTLSLIKDRERANLLLRRGVKYVFLIIFPLVFIFSTFAPEGLRFWLGPAFAQNGLPVLRWLAAGVFINALAFMPSTLIQSAGRPDLNAKFHLIEFPLYILALVFLVRAQGIVGAAIAWSGRVTLDAVLLFICAHKILPHRAGFFLQLGTAIAAGVTLLFLGTFSGTLALKIPLCLFTLLMCGLVTWFRCLAPEEHVFFLGHWRKLTRFSGSPTKTLARLESE